MSDYAAIEKEARIFTEECVTNNRIDPELFAQYDIKRGLRDKNGKGVLAGITNISRIDAFEERDGQKIPCEGKLFYRGMDIEELVRGFVSEGRFGFEEITYLLLFGELPDTEELASFKKLLGSYRSLPTHFVRDIIMKAPSKDMMNTLARSILTLYCYDDRANDTSPENVLRQCLQLTVNTPQLAIYSYLAYRSARGDGLYLHRPQPELSMAENILYLLREDKSFTELEARALDAALILHADHGSNNSTFTNHVVSSSGTDTYSVIAASLCALKGPRHGGANIKVVQMMDDLKASVDDPTNESQVREYLQNVLDKKALDGKGLIYGMGHAVYSLSDPRAEVLRTFVQSISKEKGLTEEMDIYQTVEKVATELISQHSGRPTAVNVDFYSGFLYKMLGLPYELYTPLFAIARMAGWSAHRMEGLVESSKIIRPACKCIEKRRPYVPMNER